MTIFVSYRKSILFGTITLLLAITFIAYDFTSVLAQFAQGPPGNLPIQSAIPPGAGRSIDPSPDAAKVFTGTGTNPFYGGLRKLWLFKFKTKINDEIK